MDDKQIPPTVPESFRAFLLPYQRVQKGEVNCYGEITSYTQFMSESIVTDQYILSNSTDKDISMTAVYGFAGSFYDENRYMPKITVDGENVESTLYSGRYSGSFQSVFGSQTEENDRSNLLELTEWESYEALLSDAILQMPPILR